MKVLILLTMLLTASCAKVDVADSRHDVVVSIDLEGLISQIEQICTDRYPDDNRALKRCEEDITDAVLGALAEVSR